MTDTPMCDKLLAERWKTELISEFLEFAEGKGWNLCKFYKDSGDWVPLYPAPLMADFIGVDMNEVEREKRQILEDLRSGV
jgi:hypothetical protein